MLRVALMLFSALALFAAGDAWTKVQQLKSHQELKVYKRGAAEPVNAVFADANDDRLIVVVKNKEMAIAKEDIDRIDARPPGKGDRTVTRTTTATTTEPDYTPQPPHGADVPGTSYGGGLSIGGGKPGFETVYRRGAPGKN